jgi:hypothetical protein
MELHEFIICAAIWIDDGIAHEDQPNNINTGFIVCGRRHGNCYQTITSCAAEPIRNLINSMTTNELRNYQGFMTSFDRYVDRKEAFKIAKANNQICHNLFDDIDENILTSEDLY